MGEGCKGNYKMKIAWFSPMPPQKSGIADYSQEIIHSLKDYANIDLWVDTEIQGNLLKSFKVINYLKNQESKVYLNTYDAIIYNMGNNVTYHTNIYETLLEYPGIVILHDYVLHHFFAGYWLHLKNDRSGYIDEMEYNYGKQGQSIAIDIFKGKINPIWENEDVFNYPLNKRVIENALAIITHSNFVHNLLKLKPMNLLRKINLPILEKPKKSDLKSSINNINFSKYSFIALSFGLVEPYKKIDTVISIFNKNRDLFKDVLYIIIGIGGDYYKKLLETVKALRLDNIKFLGYLPGYEVTKYINKVDICINLRYPSMGETSKSLCEQLLMGKPTIVVDVGWYSELPDNIVVKISPEQLEEDLSKTFQHLMENKHLREELAKNAREYAQKSFSMETFCNELIDFIKEVKKNSVGVNLIDQISRELSRMAIDEDQRIVDKISDELECIL